MAKSALLVDLDGTLWDSWPWYADILAQSSGNTASYFLNQLLAGGNIVKLMKKNSVSRRAFIDMVENNHSKLRFYDTVTETLATLKSRKITVGAVTNLPKWLVFPIARATAIDRFVPIIVTPSVGISAKPNPSGILAAIRMMGQTPTTCFWFVGDRSEDATAAAAANVQFAWASYGYQIERPKASMHTLGNFAEILALLEPIRV